MKRLKAWLHQLIRNRKLRSGAFSVLLTAGVILVLLLAGVLADSLEKRFALQVDFSFNGATTQGEITNAVLAQLEKNVHIYNVNTAATENATLTALLARYDAASPLITYSREDTVKNPVLLSQFADALGENQVGVDCLIIHCPQTDRARVLTQDDYYVRTYDETTGYITVGSFSYEKSITEAILYVTQDTLPTLQILTGHGEMNAEQAVSLENILSSANYLLKRVNVAAGETLDPDSLLMILCPQYDLSDQELTALEAFAQAGGDFFILSSYSDPTTTQNYHALLRSYGIEVLPGLVIAKAEDTASYLSDSPIYLLPSMQPIDATLPLIANGQYQLVLCGARAFQSSAILPPGVALSPVLMTGQAYVRDYFDGVVSSDQQPTDLEGRFPVALWADKIYDNGNQSHLFILGETTPFLDYWMIDNTDSVPFLLQMIRALQGQDPVNLDILPKNAVREGLRLGSLTPAVIVSIMLPLLVILGAALVLFPRKNL
ncbi:MAG: hypothetical protein E7324_02820 [Clostridiales bacterium]|nr:hypothetical protein [Clostridiales bacterium]